MGDVDWIDLTEDKGPVEGSWEHDNETLGFHKILLFSWVTAHLAACQEGLSSKELV
jgi:hypothetical protein